jgi:hypothetical protein
MVRISGYFIPTITNLWLPTPTSSLIGLIFWLSFFMGRMMRLS